MAVNQGDGVKSRLGSLLSIVTPSNAVSFINKNVELASYHQPAYLRQDKTSNRLVGSLTDREDLPVEVFEKNALLENIKAVEDYHDLMRQVVDGTARTPEELDQFHESCAGLILKFLREHISHHGTRSIALKSIGAMLQREFGKFRHENEILVQAFGTSCRLEKNKLLYEFEKQLKNACENCTKPWNLQTDWPGLEHISAMFCEATKNGPGHISEKIHEELKHEGGELLKAAHKQRSRRTCNLECCPSSDLDTIKKNYHTKMNDKLSHRICSEKELDVLHHVVLCELASHLKTDDESINAVTRFADVLGGEKAKVFDSMHQRLNERCQALLSECQHLYRSFLVEASHKSTFEHPFEKGWMEVQAKFRHGISADQFESTITHYESRLQEMCQGIFQDLRKEHQGQGQKAEKIIKDAAERYKLLMTDRINGSFVDLSLLMQANESFSHHARAYLKQECGDGSWEKFLPCLNEALALVFDDIKDGNEQKRIALERHYVASSRDCLSSYDASMSERCEGNYFTDSELLMHHGNAVICSLQKFDANSPDNFQPMFNAHRKSLGNQCEEMFVRYKVINDVNREHLEADVGTLLVMIRDVYWRNMDECLEKNVTSRYILLRKHNECMKLAECSVEESSLAKRKDSKVFIEGFQELSLTLYDEVQQKYAYFIDDCHSKFIRVKSECLLRYRRRMDEHLAVKFYADENLMELHEEAKASCEVEGSNVPIESNLYHDDISLIDSEIESLFCLYKVRNYNKTAETKGRCLEVIHRYGFKYSIILDKALEGRWFGRIGFLKYVHSHAKPRLLQNAEIDLQNVGADFLMTELLVQLNLDTEQLFLAKIGQLEKWDVATSSTMAWIATFVNMCGKAAVGFGAKAVGLLGYTRSASDVSDDS